MKNMKTFLARIARRPARAGRAAWAALLPVPVALAQDATSIVSDIGGYLKQAGGILITLVTIGAFLVAAYMIGNGAWKIFQDRDGGVTQFMMGVVVAVVMVVLVSYFVGEGRDALDTLPGSSPGG